ncbi:MAG: hypothetical protein AAB800_05295, partial [Patescibacteria group bacterium]
MADILSSAQTPNAPTDTSTPTDDPVAPQVPAAPESLEENMLLAGPPPLPIPDLPYSQHAQKEAVSPSVPPPQEPQVPISMPKSSSPRRVNIGATVSVLMLLLVTVPLSVFYVSQKNQVSDTRSEAAYVTSENNLYVANLDKTSFSVIWKEQFPAKGCAVAKNKKTQKEIKVCDNILSRMHLIHFTNLS